MEEEKFEEFFLSQYFELPKVRCVNSNGDYIIAASEGKGIIIYKRDEKGKFSQSITIDALKALTIYSVFVRSNQQGFFAAGFDKYIYEISLEGANKKIFTGHTDRINTIKELSDDYFISGSWDGTSRIWDIQSGEQVALMNEHQKYAVCVLGALDQDLIITGGSDNALRFYQFSTKKNFRTIEKAHTMFIKELARIEKYEFFLSCATDFIIKQWTFEGELLTSWSAHDNLIYSINAVSLGLYVSGGEEKMLKLWKPNSMNQMNSAQQIGNPGAIWSISVTSKKQENSLSDIVVASTDGFVRIFTQDPQRRATEEELQVFQNQQSAALIQSGPSFIDQKTLDSMPSTDHLDNIKGKVEGENKMFKQGNVPHIYQWSGKEQKWEYIGEVVPENPQQTIVKTYFKGDGYFGQGEYDYVFTVENPTNQKLSNLPYNDGEDPEEAAKLFLKRENLSQNQIKEITDWIKSKSCNLPIKPKDKKPDPVAIFNANYTYFPVTQPIFYRDLPNMELLVQKIMENNEAILAEDAASLVAMNAKDMVHLDGFLNVVTQVSNNLPGDSLTYSSKVLFIQKLMKWPQKYIIPIHNVARVLMFHKENESLFFKTPDDSYSFLQMFLGIMQNPNISEPYLNLILRILSNLMYVPSAAYQMVKYYKDVSKSIQMAQQRNFQKPNDFNEHLSQLYLNISTGILISGAKMEQDFLALFVMETTKNLKAEKSSSNVMKKYMIALANSMLGQPQICKPLVIVGLFNSYYPNINDATLNECFQELQRLMQDK